MIIEICVALAGIGVLIFIALIGYRKQERLMRDGRPIMAKIVKIRPVSSDDSGNTTVEYTLNAEGRRLEGREKIDTFYAPQMQPGMEIKIMYINDKDYMFVFKKQS